MRVLILIFILSLSACSSCRGPRVVNRDATCAAACRADFSSKFKEGYVEGKYVGSTPESEFLCSCWHMGEPVEVSGKKLRPAKKLGVIVRKNK